MPAHSAPVSNGATHYTAALRITERKLLRSPSWFYGWNIVGYTLVVHFVTVGCAYYVFGAFLKPLTEALGTDRFTLSLAMSVQMVLAALLAPWLGARLNAANFRTVLLAGGCITGLALAASSLVQAPWQLYLTFGVMLAIGMTCNGVVPMNALLANWFVARRGAAMGIAQLGITLSGAVLVPLVTWVILEFGWRTAFVALGIAAPVLIVPLTMLFAVATPEQIGLHPDGAREAPPPVASVAADRSVLQLLRLPQVWMLAFAVGPCFMGIASVILVLHSHATDMGFSPLVASTVVTAATLSGAIAKPAFGIISDFFPTRAVFALSILLQAMGVTGLLFVSDYELMIVTAIIFGVGFGPVAPLWSILVAELFGRDDFARVMGSMMPLTMPFNLIGLPVATLIFERTGSYLPAFAGMLGFYAVASISLWLLGRYSEPAQAMQPAQS